MQSIRLPAKGRCRVTEAAGRLVIKLPQDDMADGVERSMSVGRGLTNTTSDWPYSFNVGVSGPVAALTDEPGDNRKQRKRKSYMKMRDLRSPDERVPCLVKIADRLANVRNSEGDLLEMYRKEHEAFRLAVYRDYEEWRPLMDELDALIDG